MATTQYELGITKRELGVGAEVSGGAALGAPSDGAATQAARTWSVRGWVALAWWVACLSVFKGARLPNLWSATQFSLNYDLGFTRRGLFGSVTQLLLGDSAYRYWTFALISGAMFIACAALLAQLVRVAAERAPLDFEVRVATLVFLASPSLVVVVHLVGYLDYVGILFVLALAALSLREVSTSSLAGASAIGGTALALVHEALPIMFLPPLLFVIWCAELRRSPTIERKTARRRLGRVLAAFALPFGVALWMSTSASATSEHALELHQQLSERVDFELRFDVFEAIARSSDQNLLELMPAFWANADHRSGAIRSLLVSGPCLAFWLVYGLRAIARRRLPGRAVLTLAIGASVLAPLALNLVGYDTDRWFAIATFNAVICGLVFRSSFPRTSMPSSRRLAWFGAATVCVGLTSSPQLFDGHRVHLFPFSSQWATLGNWLAQGSMPRPER